ncbi:hypothetical protein FACS1894110_25530 [Spirochaetia bacterium]|nr:hypothetical protein FACS1894110_25530 [Spirochaetia bacterium]
MKNRSLVLGTIVLLLTAVVFLGCPTEATDPETNTVTNTVDVLGTVVSAAELKDILADKTAGTYAVLSNATWAGTSGGFGTAGFTEIPAGVIVNLYGVFSIGASDLLIGGTVNVTNGSELIGTTGQQITVGDVIAANTAAGTLNVKAGGKLTVPLADLNIVASVSGTTPTPGTITVANIEDPTAWSGGTLVKSTLAASGVVLHFDDGAIFGGAVAATDSNTLFGLAASTQPAFSVITKTAETDLSGAGGTSNFVVAKGAGVSIAGAVANFGTKTVTVNQGGSLTFSGAATLAITGDITVNGTLAFTSSSAAVAPAANVTVGPTGLITLADSAFLSTTAGKKLTINGKVTATDLVLSGVTLGSASATALDTATITGGSGGSTLALTTADPDLSPVITFAANGSIADTTSGKEWALKGGASGGTLTFTGSDTKELTLGAGTISTDETVAFVADTVGTVKLTNTVSLDVAGTTGLTLDTVLIDLSTAGTINIENLGILNLKEAANSGASVAADVLSAVIVTSAGTANTGIISGITTAGGVRCAGLGGVLASLDADNSATATKITGGSGTNNVIDKNDTFTLTSNTVVDVVSVP